MGVNITRFSEDPTTDSVLVFSWLNAAPFFSGALVGSLITDPLVNEGALGRYQPIIYLCSNYTYIRVGDGLLSQQDFLVFAPL